MALSDRVERRSSGTATSGGSAISGFGSPQPVLSEREEGLTAGADRQTLNNLLRVASSGDPGQREEALRTLRRFSPDLDPDELARRGVQAEDDPSLFEQAKRAGKGILGSVLSPIVDVIERPQQAIFGALDPDKGESRLGAAIKGAKGEGRRRDLADVLDKEAPDGGLAGVTFGMANFLGTVLTDPVTYLSLGTSSAAKSGLKEVAKISGRETAEQVAKKGLTSLDDIARGALDEGLSAAGKKALQKGSARIRFAGVDVGARGAGRSARRGIAGQARLTATSKLLEATAQADMARKAAAKAFRTPTLFDNVDELSGILGKAEADMAAARNLLTEAGEVPFTRTEWLSQTKVAQLPFVGGVFEMPEAARQLLGKAFIPAFRLGDPAARAAYKSVVNNALGETTGAVKTAAMHTQKAIAETGVGRKQLKALNSDIRKLAAGNSGIVTKSMLKQMADEAGDELRPIITSFAEHMPESVVLKGAADKGKGGFRNLWDEVISRPKTTQLTKSFDNELTAAGINIADDAVMAEVAAWRAVQDAGGGFALMRFWRRSAIRTPGFVVRNVTTDWLNLMLEKLPSASDISTGFLAARAVRSLPEERVFRFGDEATTLANTIEQSNVLGSNVFHNVEEMASFGGRASKAANSFMRAGQFLSDHARASLFMAKKSAGFSDEAAAEAVHRSLGNYSEYTQFEKTLLRNHVFPFYKFMRFNVPFQGAKLAQRPGVASLQMKLIESYNSAFPPIDGPLPERVASQGLLKGVGGRFLGVETGLAAASGDVTPVVQAIAELPIVKKFAPDYLKNDMGLSGAMQEAVSKVSGPGIGGLTKITAEMAMNQDFFTGAPIEEQEQWTRAVLTFLPEIARIVRIQDNPDKLGMALSTIAGISNMKLSDPKQRGEAFRRLDIAKKILHDAEVETNSKMMTITDLEKAGILERPEAGDRTEEEAEEATRRRDLTAEERQLEDLLAFIESGQLDLSGAESVSGVAPGSAPTVPRAPTFGSIGGQQQGQPALSSLAERVQKAQQLASQGRIRAPQDPAAAAAPAAPGGSLISGFANR